MPDIMHLIKIRASPERIYRALTTAEGIRNWWTRDSDIESRIGGVGEFRFFDGKVKTQIEVADLKPFAHVGWKTLPGSNALGGWGGTIITFDLRAEETHTLLLFAHCGFQCANECYALVNTGWAYYLVSLQQYLETGKGMPHQEKDFARMVGE